MLDEHYMQLSCYGKLTLERHELKGLLTNFGLHIMSTSQETIAKQHN